MCGNLPKFPSGISAEQKPKIPNAGTQIHFRSVTGFASLMKLLTIPEQLDYIMEQKSLERMLVTIPCIIFIIHASHIIRVLPISHAEDPFPVAYRDNFSGPLCFEESPSVYRWWCMGLCGESSLVYFQFRILVLECSLFSHALMILPWKRLPSLCAILNLLSSH